MNTWLVLSTLALVAASIGFASEPAGATHMYTCDISHDAQVNSLYCGVHCAWDAFTGAQPKRLADCFNLF